MVSTDGMLPYIIAKVAVVAKIHKSGQSQQNMLQCAAATGRIATGKGTIPMSELLTVRETAKRLGVHENTIRNWESQGLLSGIRLPGSNFRRFPRDEVERMRREMFEQYAPAVEMPEARTGVRGHVVDGDIS